MWRWSRGWWAWLAAVLAVSVAVPLQAGQGPERFVGPSSQALLQLFEDYWGWRLSVEPELATAVGVNDYNDRWRDWSAAGRARDRAAREEFLQKAMYLSPGTLSPAHLFKAYLLEYDLRSWLAAEPYLNAIEPLSPLTGAHNAVFEVIDQMPAATPRDYEHILARLTALPTYIDQHIALMRERMAAGLAQPAVVVDIVLDQVRAQAATPASASPLLAAFRAFPSLIPAAQQESLRARAADAYDTQFVPSWLRLAAFLDATYRAGARPDVGLGSARGGREAYDVLVRTFTTTRLTAEQVHAIGLAEVARIEAEMLAIAVSAGAETIAVYERRLKADPAMRFADQAEMLSYARDVLGRLQPVLPRLFAHVPRTAVGVRAIPPDQEANMASNYVSGTPDGARQGWFNMNTYQPREQVRYPIEALVLHEAVPGHHLQRGLALEMTDLPQFQKVMSATAFTEGWALYAESLGSELGVVYREPATRFGRLASERFRAVRLVVDTGLHAFGWSRDRARAYMTEHAPDASLAEVDRYIAWPGQALAYKSGELKIRELRRKAEQALGPAFDPRDFHDVVLRNGSIPLDMLEEEVTGWLAARRAN